MKNTLVLLLSALLLLAGGSAWLALYPPVLPDLGGVPDLDRGAHRVAIPLAGNDQLHGWLIPGPRRAVIVLFAGYARDHHRLWRYARFLRPDGYTLLAVDFRSAQPGARRPTTLGHWEREDAESTLAWVARDPRTRGRSLGLFGESLAASVELACAAAHPEVAAIVADCPFATGRLAVRDAFACVLHLPAWPFAALSLGIARALTGQDLAALDATAALRALDRRPVLLIQTSRGDRFAPDQVAALESAAGPGVEGWTVADCPHNELWLRHRSEYEPRVRAFFARHLLGARLWTAERVAAPAAPAGPSTGAQAGRR